MDEKTKAGLIRWTVKQLISQALTGAVLFLSAGTLRWSWGWALVLMMTGTMLCQLLMFGRSNQGFLTERSQAGENTEKWDLILVMLAVLVAPYTGWIIAGLDQRFGWSEIFPLWAQAAAVGAWIISTALLLWAMAANNFFSGTVRIQADRGHVVASDGPYAFVRHPGYLGSIIFYLAVPVALNSTWAFIPLGLGVILFLIRTALEDRTLQEKLPGYGEYAKKTRFRLIPGIW